MIVKLEPNQEMQECLASLVKNRKVLYIVCEPSQSDILKHNSKKASNLKQSKQAVMCINNKKRYESISEAAKALGLDPSGISKVINNKQSTVSGYSFYKV